LLANADLGISLGNGYIPSTVFSLPRYGMLNLHGEELPAYKNAQSVIWQIYNESCQTGYTIHEVSKGIDAGRILKQELFPIEFKASLGDTVAFNCAQILKRSVSGMIEVLANFKEYRDNAKEQKGGGSYTTPSFLQFVRIFRNYRRLYARRQDQ
jgi:methionyl-tRNA formyltransferase